MDRLRMSKVIAAVKRLSKFSTPISVYSLCNDLLKDCKAEHRVKIREMLQAAVRKGLLKKASSRYLPVSVLYDSSPIDLPRRKRSTGKRKSSRSSRRKSRSRKSRRRSRSKRNKSVHKHPLSYFQKKEGRPNIRENPVKKIKKIKNSKRHQKSHRSKSRTGRQASMVTDSSKQLVAILEPKPTS